MSSEKEYYKFRQKYIDLVISLGSVDISAERWSPEYSINPTNKKALKLMVAKNSYLEFTFEYPMHGHMFVFGNMRAVNRAIDLRQLPDFLRSHGFEFDFTPPIMPLH